MSSPRCVALLALGLWAGCPGSQGNPDDAPADAALVDAGTPDAAPLTCEMPIASCEVTIRYQGPSDDVVLRGDFATDGWTVGVPMTPADDGDGLVATLPADDQQVILYKFVVDGDTWIADPANPRRSPDGYGGENSVLRVDCDDCPRPAAFDWRDAIMYFVMLDRFFDGDPGNNDPLGLEDPADYQGGDLAGVTAKIEAGYFTDLGVNTLWITSPLDNADGAGAGSDGHTYSGYHGYWPRDLDAVESKVGDLAELQELIEVAHAHGLKVVIDYVMNHVHAEAPIYQANPSWFWPNDNGVGGDCVCGGGCQWEDDFDRKRCWFTSYLPDFDFRNGDALRYSIENAIAWAKELGVDGYRLDAVKHIEDAWVTDLRARLNAEVAFDQTFYLVGETFTGDRDLIKYYVDPDTKLDGQFDFPLRANILGTMLRRQGSMADLAGFLASNDTYYGAGAVMSTFIGNHDVPRVIGFAEDSPLWGNDWDNGASRAWSSQPGLPSGASAFQRLEVAYTFLLTSPGVPLIYYGDEIGLPGAGDPDNRRFMPWAGLTAEQIGLRDHITALTAIRRDHPALARGTRTVRGTSADVMTYEMSSAGDDVLVVLNRGDDSESAVGVPPGDYVDLLTGLPMTAPMQVPARGSLVLVAP
jgi:glycosidase